MLLCSGIMVFEVVGVTGAINGSETSVGGGTVGTTSGDWQAKIAANPRVVRGQGTKTQRLV